MGNGGRAGWGRLQSSPPSESTEFTDKVLCMMNKQSTMTMDLTPLYLRTELCAKPQTGGQ